MQDKALVFSIALALALASACSETGEPSANVPVAAPGDLRPPEAFADIADKAARSRAMFGEALRVMLHPRCTNCHPAGDSPVQGDRGERHDPPVTRGPEDHGVPGLECTSCHQDRNLELARVPGAPKWALAPKVMTWQGRSPRALCEQVKDKQHNGGKTLEQIAEHAAHDPLVAWGWAPGSGRTPAPGSQAVFGALIKAWIDAGAECPEEVTK